MSSYYRDFVRSRTKPMNTPLNHLLHMTLGISGEAGELVDAVKKHFAYGKQLDVENVLEELGDILFYVQGLLTHIDSDATLEDLMEINISKLTKRYPTQYTDEAAIARADKSE